MNNLILIDSAIILVSFIIIWKSSNYLLESVKNLSYLLKIREFSIGFIVISIATSMPELFIGVSSAIHGTPHLALGNILGANILNITFVTGIVAIISRNVVIDSKLIKKDLLYLLAVVGLPLILMMDHLLFEKFDIIIFQGISRIDGVILILFYLIYLYDIIKQEKKFKSKEKPFARKKVVGTIGILILSVIFIIIGSELLVESSLDISTILGIPTMIFGIFVVSFGTVLPELSINVKAAMTGHDEIFIGDLIGSIMANTLLVLGITAIISPVQAPFYIFISAGLFMFLSYFILFTMAESDGKLTTKEGIALLVLYLFFVFVELNINTITGS